MPCLTNATRLPQACCGWPASALARALLPLPAAAARAAEAKDEPYAGPVLRRLQRLRRLGHDVPDGPQGRQRHQPPLQGRRHPDARARTSSPRPTKHTKGGMSNEDFYAEFGDELLDAQRARLLGQQPLARRPLHGDRQARQPGLPDVRRAGRRLPGAGLPAVVPDLRQLLGHRQPRGHVARAVPAVAAEDRQRRRDRGQRTLALPRRASPSTASSRRCEEQNESRAAAAAPAAGRARARTCCTRPRSTRRRCERVTPYIPKTIPKERLSQQAEIALASFKAGVCVSANLTIGQFDSHANNDPDQMKLIPEFLAGIALPDPPGRGAEDPRASSSSSSRARWAARRTTTTATARTTGRSARSCSSAAASRATASSAPPTRSSSHVPLDPQTLKLRQGQGHPRPPRAHPRSRCANSPASPTTR